MSNYATLAASATDQYLSAVAEVQETFLKSLNSYAELAAKVPTIPMPDFPDLPVAFATPMELTEASFAFATKSLRQQKETLLSSMAACDELAANVSTVAPEFAAAFPTPSEVIEANFAFATKSLKQQKAFTDKLLAAIVPQVKPAKKAAKKAAKKTARK